MSRFSTRKRVPTLKARWETAVMPSSSVRSAGRLSATKAGLIATNERVMTKDPVQEWVDSWGETRLRWRLILGFRLDLSEHSLVIQTHPMLGYFFEAEVPREHEGEQWVSFMRRCGVEGGTCLRPPAWWA